MKRTTILCFLWLTLALVQTGCTSLLFVGSKMPAEVSVTHDQWKVVVLNRYDANLLPSTPDIMKVKVLNDGARHGIAGVLEAINADVTYNIVAVDTAASTSTGSGTTLTPAQVQEIYLKHPHHLLLSLDHFDTYFEPEVSLVKDREGDFSKIAYYRLFTKSTWSLHDSTGTLMDQISLSRDGLYSARGVYGRFKTIGPATSETGPPINKLAKKTGWDYWDRMSPKSITFIRPYYSGKPFAPAASWMVAGNWTEAIMLLKPLTELKKKKDAAKAAYNLAVAYEAMGQLEEAKYWANIASDKNDKLAAMLLTELNR